MASDTGDGSARQTVQAAPGAAVQATAKGSPVLPPAMTTAALLVVASVPRVLAAFFDHGIYWPDEIFQSLEQAHRVVFGYGHVPWEFGAGARSWVFPGALAGVLKLATIFGAGWSPAYIVVAKLSMVALAVWATYLCMKLAGHLAGPAAALLAGALAAVFPASLVFSHRCMSEMASAPLLVAAPLLLVRSRPRPWPALLAGAVAVLATFLRYQNGMLAVGLWLLLAAQRRWRDVAWYAAGAVAAGMLGGLLDLATWGRPFHSLIAYVDFNLLKGKSAIYGIQPSYFYPKVAWTATGISLVPIVAGFLAGARRAPGLALVVAAYVLAHSLIGHKELRFLMPVEPLGLAIAGVGLACLLRRLPRIDSLRLGRVTVGLAVLLCLLGGSKAARLTMGEMGQEQITGYKISGDSPWHFFEGINRLLWRVGRRGDLCGLILVGPHIVSSGGYAYLHRDVPMLWASTAGELRPQLRSANLVIGPVGIEMPPGFTEIDRADGWFLALRAGGCGPPPPGYTRTWVVE